jgi:hypothetical protein
LLEALGGKTPSLLKILSVRYFVIVSQSGWNYLSHDDAYKCISL